MFNFFGKSNKANTLSQAEAKRRLDEDKSIVLLDVRTPQEYRESHISNSRLLPLDSLKAEVKDALIDKSATIFVYCRSGNRSAMATKLLSELGYTNVYNIGGIMSWPYETEKGNKK